jgi:hypothetical protein
MGERLMKAGAGLERHFPELDSGGGVALLRHSYALIIGLWQMSAESAGNRFGCPMVTGPGEVPPIFNFAYPDELDCALVALWNGTIGTERSADAP